MLGKNLVQDIAIGPNGWSKWRSPTKDKVNSCFNIGYVTLGEKKEGDIYSCQIEIEFKDVDCSEGMPFLFQTQGAQDGGWTAGSIWGGSLVYLDTPPKNGIYTFTSSTEIR